MSTVQTDFRCYKRGQAPGDFTPRWNTPSAATVIVDGALSDLAHRNALRVRFPPGTTTTPTSTQSALSWNALDVGVSANIEILARVRAYRLGNAGADARLCSFVIRGSGTGASPTAYRVLVNLALTTTGSTVEVQKVVAGVITSLNTSAAKNVVLGSWFYLRFRVNGTTVQAKIWSHGDTEPGGWDATATDAAISAAGWNGPRFFYGDETWDIAYLAGSTAGETAPAESTLPQPLDQWCLDPAVEMELVAEVEHADPTTGAVVTEFISNLGRSGTAADDFPASTAMEPLLKDAGEFGMGLAADQQFDGAALPRNAKPLVFDNPVIAPATTGRLDSWIDLTFSGRPVVVRAGKAWLDKANGIRMPARHMEVLYSTFALDEPDVAEVVTLQTRAPIDALQVPVAVRRNIGISTGLKVLTATGQSQQAANAAYDVKSFTVMQRIQVPAAGIAGTATSNLSFRSAGFPNSQYVLNLAQASHATNPHQLNLLVGTGAATLINAFSGVKVNTGDWVDSIFAISETTGQARWYWLVNGLKVASGAVGTNPAVNTGSAWIWLAAAALGIQYFDCRIYNSFIAEDEARSIFSALAAPETRCVSMLRCNDNTGGVATDYSSIANNMTMGGVQNTDWSWVPTYMGSAETAGQPMPLQAGVTYHVPTQAVDPARELFRFSDKAQGAGTTLNARAKGLPIATPAAWTNPAAGVVDIVGASDQPVTVGAEYDGSGLNQRPNFLPYVVRDVIFNRGALSMKSMDYDSFDAARRVIPHYGGVFFADPPTVAALLEVLAENGLHYRMDNSGRIGVGYLSPPINPGPYGQESLLEFLGHPGRGVTFGGNAAYELAGTSAGNDWGLMAWVKIHGDPYDQSVNNGPNGFDPGGYSILGCGSKVGTGGGYYIGIDFITGKFVFAESTAAGNQCIAGNVKSTGYAVRDKWILVQAVHTGGFSGIRTTVDPNPTALILISSAAAGLPAKFPLCIGHHPTYHAAPESHCGFYGSIAYVAGFNPSATTADSLWTSWQAARPTTTGLQFLVPLTDGEGEEPADTKNTRVGRITGCRWSPRMRVDCGQDAAISISGVRRAVPAWRVDARYQPNDQPLAGGDVAAGVSASDRVALSKPALDQPDSDSNIATNTPQALDKPLQTRQRYSGQSGQPGVVTYATAVAAGMRARLSVGRKYADVKDRRRDALRLLPTDEVVLYHPRYLPAGRAMRVYSLIAALREMSANIGTWG